MSVEAIDAKTPPELLEYIEQNADSICVSVQTVEGGERAVPLSDLPVREALRYALKWVREGHAPERTPDVSTARERGVADYFDIDLRLERGVIFFRIEPQMETYVQLGVSEAEGLGRKLIEFSRKVDTGAESALAI